MAKLSAKGRTEVLRYFNVRLGKIVAFMSDGQILVRSVYTNGWKTAKKIPLGAEYDNVLNKHKKIMTEQPSWASLVKTLPSESRMREWVSNGVAETVDGQTIEPDGVAENGVPSWLVALKVI